MNPAKAIQILTEDLDHPTEHLYAKHREAEKLGIEALKWRALMEECYGSWCGPLLPGETKV